GLVGGAGQRRQRRRSWYCALYGWEYDAQLGCRTNSGLRIPPRWQATGGRVCSRGIDAATAVALYTGADHFHVPDSSMQPTSFNRAAVVPMAPADIGPVADQSACYDARVG